MILPLPLSVGLRTTIPASTWWRAVQLRHLATPLGTAHTTYVPGRFSGGSPAHSGPEALYLAEDHLVAQFEVKALLGSPLPGFGFAVNPLAGQWAYLKLDVALTNVADLTDSSNLATLGTSEQELTGDWRAYALRPASPPLAPPYWSNVPTHQLGAALEQQGGFEGMIIWSAAVPDKKNLVVFPKRKLATSAVSYTDPANGTVWTM